MNRSITRRYTTSLTAAAVAAALGLVLFAGPGLATQDIPAATSCESTCLDAGAAFAATVPVSFDPDSARQLAAVLDAGDRARPADMRFTAVPAGAEIELVEIDGSIAAVRLLDGAAAGRIGYVPTGWVSAS